MSRKKDFKKDIKEYIREAEKLTMLGLTLKDIAIFWDISARTLHRWKRDIPELARAFERGKVKAKKSVLKAMFDAITKRYNSTLTIFYLINRYPDEWRDIKNIHIGGESGGTLKVEFIPAKKAKKEEKKDGAGESDKG